MLATFVNWSFVVICGAQDIARTSDGLTFCFHFWVLCFFFQSFLLILILFAGYFMFWGHFKFRVHLSVHAQQTGLDSLLDKRSSEVSTGHYRNGRGHSSELAPDYLGRWSTGWFQSLSVLFVFVTGLWIFMRGSCVPQTQYSKT